MYLGTCRCKSRKNKVAKNNLKNYIIDEIVAKDKIYLREIFILEEYGIRYENIGGQYIIVYYDGNEFWLKF